MTIYIYIYNWMYGRRRKNALHRTFLLYTAQSFNIENINAISQSWSAIGGYLIIDTLGDDIRIGEPERDVVNSIIADFDNVLQSLKSPKSAAVIQQSSAADELKKFKELLDMGVITQEEFDVKKKQLLGL